MEEFLISLRYDVWTSVVNGYKAPNTLPTDTNEIWISNNNSMGWRPLVELVLNKGIVIPCTLVHGYCILAFFVSWCLQTFL